MVKRKLCEPLEDHKGNLYFDGLSVEDLAKKYDTPLYVISEKRIRENYNRLYNAIVSKYKDVRIYYACKANTNLTVLKILKSEGAYLDAVSTGEVFMGLNSGFSPENILFTGTSVRNDELKFLIDTGITVNIDSQSELDRLLKISVPPTISVRVNPEIGAGHHEHCVTAGLQTKFGLWENEVLKAYTTAKKARVERFGIHMHIGSGILEIEPYIQAVEKLLSIAKRVHDELGIVFDFIDLGGGLGVPYQSNDTELNIPDFTSQVVSLFKSKVKEYHLGKPFLCIEPGRYLVCDASVLLTTVNTVKVTPYRKFICVDSGFNTLIRPAMYGSYHEILVANKLSRKKTETFDVVGPICETGDVLAKNRELPLVVEGDVLAILNAGAYGFSMSSQYNSRPRAAEVMIRQGKPVLVREREQFQDLLTSQRVAQQ
ncbi:MAG: diaminopimelate decarboxylase [Candidatus Bathyarchaeota archaeon]|uniref:diaminopimelate decarboxylase n=1 Tax=Candidatus Bathycorpusculum sp. TaxID=2994959 RepID=UPI00283007D5|nr:diaminopimelate decarboxylase [Candidatus Termiticorpusculum sp.]MCL2257259.1 diaminopimelate decarboxylase [Candidatus Termiticorpusculum sp.]MCL2292592.1 diaminopimelate decarboxylase [Candidatus Termiticorpusculum sp.]